MNMFETQAAPLQVSARQKPENVERDRLNLQVVECIQGIFRNRRRCPDQTTCGPDRYRARSDSSTQRCVHDLSRFCCRQRELRLQPPENPRRTFLAQLEDEAREASLRLHDNSPMRSFRHCDVGKWADNSTCSDTAGVFRRLLGRVRSAVAYDHPTRSLSNFLTDQLYCSM